MMVIAVAGVIIAVAILLRCYAARMYLHCGLCVVYVAGIFGVGLVVNDRARILSGKTFGYTATRALPEHTRLLVTDLKPPEHLPPGYFWDLPKLGDLTGKYLRKARNANDVIDRSMVEGQPDVGDAVLFPVSDAGLVALLNAGSTVQLCEGADSAQICVDAARVVATVTAGEHSYGAFERKAVVTLKTGTPRMRLVTLR